MSNQRYVKMKMVHAISEGKSPDEIEMNKKKERKLVQTKSSSLGNIGAVDKNSKAAELQKMIQDNMASSVKLTQKNL